MKEGCTSKGVSDRRYTILNPREERGSRKGKVKGTDKQREDGIRSTQVVRFRCNLSVNLRFKK